MTYEEFCQQDEVLRTYYKSYVVDEYVPSAEEITEVMHFFAVFSLGCSRMGLEEIRETMSLRLHSYIWMLKKRVGYTHKRTYRAGRDFGTLLIQCMERAFWVRTD